MTLPCIIEPTHPTSASASHASAAFDLVGMPTDRKATTTTSITTAAALSLFFLPSHVCAVFLAVPRHLWRNVRLWRLLAFLWLGVKFAASKGRPGEGARRMRVVSILGARSRDGLRFAWRCLGGGVSSLGNGVWR